MSYIQDKRRDKDIATNIRTRLSSLDNEWHHFLWSGTKLYTSIENTLDISNDRPGIYIVFDKHDQIKRCGVSKTIYSSVSKLIWNEDEEYCKIHIGGYSWQMIDEKFADLCKYNNS